ncbi:hypothetical protein GCM10017710_05540 [Arthrobacter ramosus]
MTEMKFTPSDLNADSNPRRRTNAPRANVSSKPWQIQSKFIILPKEDPHIEQYLGLEVSIAPPTNSHQQQPESKKWNGLPPLKSGSHPYQESSQRGARPA